MRISEAETKLMEMRDSVRALWMEIRDMFGRQANVLKSGRAAPPGHVIDRAIDWLPWTLIK